MTLEGWDLLVAKKQATCDHFYQDRYEDVRGKIRCGHCNKEMEK